MFIDLKAVTRPVDVVNHGTMRNDHPFRISSRAGGVNDIDWVGINDPEPSVWQAWGRVGYLIQKNKSTTIDPATGQLLSQLLGRKKEDGVETIDNCLNPGERSFDIERRVAIAAQKGSKQSGYCV